MHVIVSDEAKRYVEGRGGILYVRPTRYRCCGGALTLLDSTTVRPSDAPDFACVDAEGIEGIEVRFLGDSAQRPHELVIELRGRARRRRPTAYWDGCAFKI